MTGTINVSVGRFKQTKSQDLVLSTLFYKTTDRF